MRRSAKSALLVVWLPFVVACGGDGGGAAVEGGDPGELVSSLDVRVEGDTVDLGLYVANATESPVDLEFPTAQRYDFVVLTAAGEAVWRWSSEQGFAQVTGVERVGAGGMLEYRAAWSAAGAAAGRYIAEGQLVAQNRPVTLRTEFELSAQ